MSHHGGRVLVHLAEGLTKPAKMAHFTQCIVQSLKLDSDSGFVHCTLSDDKLVLARAAPGDSSPVLLTHPPFCPVLQLTSEEAETLPHDIRERGVNVGVVTLLETRDSQILLTRRAAHMRTFPGIWVPPGGHIEVGETLMEAGLRELQEETGLEVRAAVTSERVLCLWESVFPYILSMGQPRRHHVVVYLHLGLATTAAELQDRIRLDPEEVDAAMWLDPVLARLVADDAVPDSCPPRIQTLSLDKAGAMRTQWIPASVMTNSAPTRGEDVERVSTGTRYALAQWLKTKKSDI